MGAGTRRRREGLAAGAGAPVQWRDRPRSRRQSWPTHRSSLHRAVAADNRTPGRSTGGQHRLVRPAPPPTPRFATEPRGFGESLGRSRGLRFLFTCSMAEPPVPVATLTQAVPQYPMELGDPQDAQLGRLLLATVMVALLVQTHHQRRVGATPPRHPQRGHRPHRTGRPRPSPRRIGTGYRRLLFPHWHIVSGSSR